jgi:hypothetical protein
MVVILEVDRQVEECVAEHDQGRTADAVPAEPHRSDRHDGLDDGPSSSVAK